VTADLQPPETRRPQATDWHGPTWWQGYRLAQADAAAGITRAVPAGELAAGYSAGMTAAPDRQAGMEAGQ
jgi:hypothetical protein